MSFEIKNFNSIVGSMITYFTDRTNKVTDFNVGAVIRTIFESVGRETEEIYTRMWQGLLEAIPTAVFRAFDFPLLADSKATGVARFSSVAPAGSPVLIPQGTVIQVPNTTKQYVTTSDVTLGIGETEVFVGFVATETGSAFNTPLNTITEILNPITGIDAVTNPANILNGRDTETQSQRRERFREFILSLARATKDGVEFGAKTVEILDSNGFVIEFVDEAFVDEVFFRDPNAPAGVADLYIYNGSANTSQALVAETQKVIDGFEDNVVRVPGYKAAGVIIEVLAVIELSIVLEYDVVLRDGLTIGDIQADVDAAHTSYFSTLGISDDVLISEALCALLTVDGILDATPTGVACPVPNPSVGFNQVAIYGGATLTEV